MFCLRACMSFITRDIVDRFRCGFFLLEWRRSIVKKIKKKIFFAKNIHFYYADDKDKLKNISLRC